MSVLEQILNKQNDNDSDDFLIKKSPAVIESNLNPKFVLRPYQLEAFGRFAYFFENLRKPDTPTHLLYHMATGSGKTLVMAGLIVLLHKLGYSNFIFLVNSTNIIEKTKDNFLNQSSSKYLFNSTLNVDGRTTLIRCVTNFEAAVPNAINIAFETVQGLHAALNAPHENSLTANDFRDKKIVFIADEAHHINVDTKNGGADDATSWESTLMAVFNANADNFLLEFTATADLGNRLIAQKYADKLIFDYALRRFCADGYSKNVRIMQSAADGFTRAIQACLLSIYRSKLLERYGTKPVILFKSHTIRESNAFQNEFTQKLNNLNVSALSQIRNSNKTTALSAFFDYCLRNNITDENLIAELKIEFGTERQLSVNSKDDCEYKQRAINTLECADNPFRAIFAVDKLNEGWDVLNLFDIVQLSEVKASAIKKTSIQEVQLIGRGARYCPFGDGEDASRRKYDGTTDEMAVCEQLFYHASYFPAYINELNAKLIQSGLSLADDKKTMPRSNQNHRASRRQPSDVFNAEYVVDMEQDKSVETDIFSSDDKKIHRQYHKLSIDAFDKCLIYKALNKSPFYNFCNLKRYLPELQSVEELIDS